MSKSWAGGSTRAWRQTRVRVLVRDRAAGWGCRAHEEGWCARAGAGPHECTHRADVSGPYAGHAHHTHGRDITGDDMRYIVSSCAACNLAIGDPGKADDPPLRPVTQW